MMQTIIITGNDQVALVLEQSIDRFVQGVEVVGVFNSHSLKKDWWADQHLDLAIIDFSGPEDHPLVDLEHKERTFRMIGMVDECQLAGTDDQPKCDQYLSLPLSLTMIVQSINQIKMMYREEALSHTFADLIDRFNRWTYHEQKIIVRDKSAIHVIKIKDLLYCAADGGYTQFYLSSGQRIISSKGLKLYDQTLGNAGFFRVHHSYLVNHQYIVKFNRLESTLLLENGHLIPVSSRRKEILESLLSSKAL